eukprot:CAMPEP_0182514502 /NCGR_PEP_ID=MMETSP1321-20130603/35868_1 /TAXON_ID=91990 /ORGANISM="Bolidomonas sp., Strain RCC1657" /LENGTH=31 /DNA_ID= /DNA_START= /DNA_END= /DNA_ORIENTATION=
MPSRTPLSLSLLLNILLLNVLLPLAQLLPLS